MHDTTSRPGRRPELLRPATTRVTTTAETTVVIVTGEIDVTVTARLRAQLATAIAMRPPALILDLSDVGFCSAQGLSVLLATSTDAYAAGIPCAIVTDKPAVLRPISLLCIDRVLPVHRTLNDALDWLAALPHASGAAHRLPHVV